MAFHPFAFFRKRMKVFLAILTVFTMFIFILQIGGKGDPIDSLMRAFGGGKGVDNTEVTTLYNKKITVTDLENLQRNRRATNAFILRATRPLYLSPSEVLQEMMQMMMGRGQALAGLDFLEQQKVNKIFTDANFSFFTQGTRDYNKLRRDLTAFKAELAAQENKADAVKTIQRMIVGTGIEQWAVNHPGEPYFGGTLTTDGLLDFLIWQQQADRLNITLTDGDVRKLVNHEAESTEGILTGDSAKDATTISTYLAGMPKPPLLKDFYATLRNEFRVRLAQEALLGTTPGARAGLGAGYGTQQLPSGSTPEQFFDFFKDRRTRLHVVFLKVPVNSFTTKIDQLPPEAELRKFFERYKEDEPDPLRERPGFKVPRRVKIEWVTTDPESPYYRDSADKALPIMAELRPLMAGAGIGSAPALDSALAVDLAPKMADQAEYAAYVKGVNSKSWWEARSTDTDSDNPYATGIRRPETRAAVAGQLIGSGMTGATPWSVAGTLGGAIDIQMAEQKVRAVGITLAGTNPFLPGVLAQEAGLVTVPVASFDAVRGLMATRFRERLAKDMAGGALANLTKDLEAKHFNPKDAADYVDKNANPAHGISHGVMKEARDFQSIADDPDIAALRKAVEGKVPFTPSARQSFASQFFPQEPLLYRPQPLRGSIDSSNYEFWLTENDKAYVPTFDQARPTVEAAWKLQQARKLAEDEAKQIIEAVKNRPEGISPDRFIKDEAARRGYDSFDRVDIAKLVPVPQILIGGETQYHPFTFSETQFANPRPDVVDKLLQDLKEPGAGTVVKDLPDRNEYVAVLVKKPDVPSQDEFLDVYRNAGNGLDSLWSMYQSEREAKFRTNLMKQLRVEARATLDTQGKYKIDPDVRKRLVFNRSDREE